MSPLSLHCGQWHTHNDHAYTTPATPLIRGRIGGEGERYETVLLRHGRFAQYPLYKQDGLGKDAICICCFHIGNSRWYAMEGQPQNDDFTIFCSVLGMGKTKYGYSSVRKMEEIAINHPMLPTPLRIKQAPSICNVPIGSIPDKELQRFLSYMAE